MQHLPGKKFLFGCPGHRARDGLPTEEQQKVSGARRLPAQGEGRRGCPAGHEAGKRRGLPQGFYLSCGQKASPREGKSLRQAALVYIVGGPWPGRKKPCPFSRGLVMQARTPWWGKDGAVCLIQGQLQGVRRGLVIGWCWATSDIRVTSWQGRSGGPIQEMRNMGGGSDWGQGGGEMQVHLMAKQVERTGRQLDWSGAWERSWGP